MKKDRIFFGESGLTSTSANHLANLAKEAYQATVEELESVQLYNEDLSLLGTTGKTPVSWGEDKAFLDSVEQKLRDIADLKSLIAWLREAIKARKKLVEEINDMSLNEWLACTDIPVPEAPVREPSMTVDDWLATLTVKQRNAFFLLETRCATIGKYIHEDGALSNARKRLNKVIANPAIVRDSGRDTTILTRTPSVTVEDVDNTFFQLQKKHREYQAQLNSMRHECDTAIEQDILRKTNDYNAAMAEYESKMACIQRQFRDWKLKEILKLEDLKIVIPDALKPVYDKVSSLGK